MKATKSVFVSAMILMCTCHHRMFVLTWMFLWYRSVGKSPEVRFIDFDWAGRAGHVFYPPFMNHRDDVWPTDIQEFAPALQKHDRRLLKRHLAHGPSAMMHTHPNMARQPKHRLQFLNASHRHAKMCPCARLFQIAQSWHC